MEKTKEQETADLIAAIVRDSQQDMPTPVEEVKTVEKIVENDNPLPELLKEVEVAVEEPKIINSTDHSKQLKELIRLGLIENFTITVDVDGKEEDVFINDLENCTEEGLTQIIEGWKSAQKTEKDSKYISKEGLDDSFLKIIETKKSGGNVEELLRVNVTAIDQLTQLKENIDNEQVQINIVAHSLEQQGIKKGVIKAQIDAHIEDGTLEDEANGILNSHLATHRQAIEYKRQGELERVEKEKEDLKVFKKTLISEYKLMDVPEKIQKLFVDNVTNLDQDKISNTDKLYFQAIQDPKSAAELNFFLNDREAYKKYVSSKAVLNTKQQEIKSLFKININKTNKPELSKDAMTEFREQVIRSNN